MYTTVEYYIWYPRWPKGTEIDMKMEINRAESELDPPTVITKQYWPQVL